MAEISGLLHELVKIWFHWVEAWGYAGVFILMAMESSIFPVPSEIVMPPAAFWASQGRMSFSGVILAGTAGSWFGSAVTYWVAQKLGLPLLKKYGRYFLISPEKMETARGWIQNYGTAGVFLARLLPVIRHLISIPAGAFHMPFGRFSLVTTVGAGIWCWVLAEFGARVIGSEPGLLDSPDAMIHAIKAKLLWFVLGVVGVGALYALMTYLKKSKITQSSLNS